MKHALRPASSTDEQKIAALRDGATTFNADLTKFVSRDKKGKVIEVAILARGSYAKRLSRFLDQLNEEQS